AGRGAGRRPGSHAPRLRPGSGAAHRPHPSISERRASGGARAHRLPGEADRRLPTPDRVAGWALGSASVPLVRARAGAGLLERPRGPLATGQKGVSPMKIALAQFSAGPDKESNLRRMLALTAEAAGAGAGVVLFPECSMVRLPPDVGLAPVAEPLDGQFVS